MLRDAAKLSVGPPSLSELSSIARPFDKGYRALTLPSFFHGSNLLVPNIDPPSAETSHSQAPSTNMYICRGVGLQSLLTLAVQCAISLISIHTALRSSNSHWNRPTQVPALQTMPCFSSWTATYSWPSSAKACSPVPRKGDYPENDVRGGAHAMESRW